MQACHTPAPSPTPLKAALPHTLVLPQKDKSGSGQSWLGRPISLVACGKSAKCNALARFAWDLTWLKAGHVHQRWEVVPSAPVSQYGHVGNETAPNLARDAWVQIAPERMR
eukprot:11897056-Alexandrium_andersonii.AAC.1